MKIGDKDGITHILASTSTTTGRSVEEVLLKTVANSSAKLGTCTAECASGAVAGISVVPGRVAAHYGLALQVSAGALPAGTFQTRTAAVSVWTCDIGRADGRITCTRLGWITRACSGTADCAIGSQLAGTTACLVAVIAYGASLELASCGFAAGVVAAALFTTTITVFTVLHDAIATLLATDGGDAFVIGETSGFDTVAPKRTADVADTAGTEVGDAR